MSLGRYSPGTVGLSSCRIESRYPSNFPVAKYSMYCSKGLNATAILLSVSFSFSKRGGESTENLSPDNPHLEAHHLPSG